MSAPCPTLSLLDNHIARLLASVAHNPREWERVAARRLLDTMRGHRARLVDAPLQAAVIAGIIGPNRLGANVDDACWGLEHAAGRTACLDGIILTQAQQRDLCALNRKAAA